MYEIQLTDSTTSAVVAKLNVPLIETPIEGATDVVTLDNNVSTYFTANKRLWEHTWSFLSEAEFNVIKGFYDRQFTTFKYPLLTISAMGITNIPVRMTISPKRIIDNCGTVEDAKITLRESRQMA